MALRDLDRTVRLLTEEGDFVSLANPLPVTLAGGATGGTSQADGSAFIEGTSPVTPIAGLYSEVPGAALTEDEVAAVRITDQRALHVSLRDAAGAEVVPTANGFVSVLNSLDLPAGQGASVTNTGAFEDVSDYSAIEVFISTDQISATNLVLLQWSDDGVAVRDTDAFTHTSATGLTRSYFFLVKGPWFRLSYRNGTTPSSFLRVTITFRRHPKEVALQYGFNGRTWEALALNGQAVLFSTAARTATTALTGTQRNVNLRGIWLILNVTVAPAAPGSGGLWVELYLVDISGNNVRINADPASMGYIRTTGSFRYLFYPGAADSNMNTMGSRVVQVVAAPVPLLWKALVRHYDGQSYSYNLEVDTQI